MTYVRDWGNNTFGLPEAKGRAVMQSLYWSPLQTLSKAADQAVQMYTSMCSVLQGWDW